MSSPLAAEPGPAEPISVQPAALEALAEELSALAAELLAGRRPLPVGGAHLPHRAGR